MDVFAFASLSETQGMVLAEAMAAGLPVVALNASGVREVVRDGQNGFMLPKNAPPLTFAAHLGQLHRNRTRRRAFGMEARRTAELFSRERCADLALAFYTEVRRDTRRDRLLVDRSPWGQMIERVGMEWKMLVEKAQSVAEAFGGGTGQQALFARASNP